MIKKLYVLTLISLLVFNISFSQDLLSYTTESSATERDNAEKKSPVFEFKAYPRDSYLNSITKEMAGEHLLGELIAKKIYLFNEFYTSEENLFLEIRQRKQLLRNQLYMKQLSALSVI